MKILAEVFVEMLVVQFAEVAKVFVAGGILVEG